MCGTEPSIYWVYMIIRFTISFSTLYFTTQVLLYLYTQKQYTFVCSNLYGSWTKYIYMHFNVNAGQTIVLLNPYQPWLLGIFLQAAVSGSCRAASAVRMMHTRDCKSGQVARPRGLQAAWSFLDHLVTETIDGSVKSWKGSNLTNKNSMTNERLRHLFSLYHKYITS